MSSPKCLKKRKLCVVATFSSSKDSIKLFFRKRIQSIQHSFIHRRWMVLHFLYLICSCPYWNKWFALHISYGFLGRHILWQGYLKECQSISYRLHIGFDISLRDCVRWLTASGTYVCLGCINFNEKSDFLNSYILHFSQKCTYWMQTCSEILLAHGTC